MSPDSPTYPAAVASPCSSPLLLQGQQICGLKADPTSDQAAQHHYLLWQVVGPGLNLQHAYHMTLQLSTCGCGQPAVATPPPPPPPPPHACNIEAQQTRIRAGHLTLRGTAHLPICCMGNLKQTQDSTASAAALAVGGVCPSPAACCPQAYDLTAINAAAKGTSCSLKAAQQPHRPHGGHMRTRCSESKRCQASLSRVMLTIWARTNLLKPVSHTQAPLACQHGAAAPTWPDIMVCRHRSTHNLPMMHEAPTGTAQRG